MENLEASSIPNAEDGQIMIHLFYEVMCKRSNSVLLTRENAQNMMLRRKIQYADCIYSNDLSNVNENTKIKLGEMLTDIWAEDLSSFLFMLFLSRTKMLKKK